VKLMRAVTPGRRVPASDPWIAAASGRAGGFGPLRVLTA
jgi:hypothetical protein